MNAKLKELLGALIFKLNEKIESVRQNQLLTDEIREGIIRASSRLHRCAGFCFN